MNNGKLLKVFSRERHGQICLLQKHSQAAGGSIWKVAMSVPGRGWWLGLGLMIRVERVYCFLFAKLLDDGHSLS